MKFKVKVICFRKSKIVQKIKIPAKFVTNIVFGGRNLDILFVTTGSNAFNLSSGEILTSLSTGSGMVYMIKGVGARGFPGRTLSII